MPDTPSGLKDLSCFDVVLLPHSWPECVDLLTATFGDGPMDLASLDLGMLADCETGGSGFVGVLRGSGEPHLQVLSAGWGVLLGHVGLILR